MAKQKSLNISELIDNYDDNFINSISLKNITNYKELKALLIELERANYVVTSFYETMYNDYITMINSDNQIEPQSISDETLTHYKNLASKIQKAYSYVLYINTFENPFRSFSRKR